MHLVGFSHECISEDFHSCLLILAVATQSLSLYLWEAPETSFSVYRHGVNLKKFNLLLYNSFSLTSVLTIHCKCRVMVTPDHTQ